MQVENWEKLEEGGKEKEATYQITVLYLILNMSEDSLQYKLHIS